MFKRTALLFAASALCVGIVSASTNASAFYRRISASTCRTDGAAGGTPAYNGGYLQNPGVVACGFPEDDTINTTNAGGVWVDVSAIPSGGRADASACISYYGSAGAAGGECGNYARATGAGWTSLSLDVSTWNAHPYDYPYVSVNTTGRFIGYGVWTK